MRNFFQILLYMLGFTVVSIVISQIPAVFRGVDFFVSDEETILSIIAGTSSGLIVGLFNIRSFRREE